MLRLCGAEIREVPAVPYKDPNNYVHVSERLAKELGAKGESHGVLWANQWDNTANRDGHYPQHRAGNLGADRRQGGRLHLRDRPLVETLSGVGMYLKQQNPNVKIAVSDPMGAAMYHWFKHGELKSEGSSITEGIGQGRVTEKISRARRSMTPTRSRTPRLFR